MTVRVRFAPAPSGELHAGHAHTALFAWLFARHHAGTFILRIEDTDRDRARPEFVDPICDAMEWLGLDWDEGPRVGGPHEPYLMSERLDLHREVAANLEASGAVYRCWCTREDITQRTGTPHGYDRFCRTRSDTPDAPYQLRIAVPEGRALEFEDLILGKVRRGYDELTDPPVTRNDGSPLYALAVVADDIAMGITHVIRGDDLLTSTFPQLLLYRALGVEPPPFAHVPVVLGPDRAKLGKRHGSDSLQEFRRDGILGEAMLNYMALLGWSSPSQDEVLSKDRLVAEFTLARVNPSPSVFDYAKLRWLNQHYIKTLPPGEVAGRVLELYPETPADALQKALEVPEFVTDRVWTLAEIPDAIRYLHARPDVDPAAREKVLEEWDTVVPAAADVLEKLEPWTIEAITERLQALCEEVGLNRRKGLAPIRVAISGTSTSLPLFESIWIIGRDESLARLRSMSA